MKRDWKYVVFVLEAVEASRTPFSTLTVQELTESAKACFGAEPEVEQQIQATVLQLWYGEFLILEHPRLAGEGLARGQLRSLTWKGYDLLESKRT
ncbi:hypothetical protein YA0697_22930 [Pseudomonas viridiflava]|uniref:hypothetical protein n=1 Tax=Pseudomonas viridiflava TaxID=33069 RepID=UPI0018E5D964|nr:hypothetical protein [Pseudomonas viridiflava]MBI6684565.1 hypothetical protein [Pseudomonas viridiflava]